MHFGTKSLVNRKLISNDFGINKSILKILTFASIKNTAGAFRLFQLFTSRFDIRNLLVKYFLLF
jgi:hypothetical protein